MNRRAPRRGALVAAALLVTFVCSGCGGCGGSRERGDAAAPDASRTGSRPAGDGGGSAEDRGGDYEPGILRHREEKDSFLRSARESPAPAAQRGTMAPLDYYPVDPAWRLRLPFQRDPDPRTLDLVTNVGEMRRVERVGSVEIERDGLRAPLHLYRPLDEDRPPGSLWVPFVDAGAGRETYAAGRYLDAEILADGTVLLDFNLAYNPYCAYGWDSYSCPLTPRENRIPIFVRAGEKGFHR